MYNLLYTILVHKRVYHIHYESQFSHLIRCDSRVQCLRQLKLIMRNDCMGVRIFGVKREQNLNPEKPKKRCDKWNANRMGEAATAKWWTLTKGCRWVLVQLGTREFRFWTCLPGVDWTPALPSIIFYKNINNCDPLMPYVSKVGMHVTIECTAKQEQYRYAKRQKMRWKVRTRYSWPTCWPDASSAVKKDEVEEDRRTSA